MLRLQVKGLASMRATEDLVPLPLGANAFVHSDNFLDYEQYKTIGRAALMNIGLGFLMIAVIIVVLIANPLASFLTFISVASAILELVGFMYFRGTYIDSVTVIFLVISLGLAVDYSVHVAHGFLANRCTEPAKRLQTTMRVRHPLPPKSRGSLALQLLHMSNHCRTRGQRECTRDTYIHIMHTSGPQCMHVTGGRHSSPKQI